MKLYYANMFLLFVGILLSGCGANKRGMVGEHYYYSESSPALQIEVDPTFQYTKGQSDQVDHIFKGPYNRRYLLIDYEPNNVIDHRVDYYNHPHHWIYSGIPESSIIKKGEITVLDKTWFFADTFEEREDGCSLAIHLRRFTDDQNLFLIKYLLWHPPEDCLKYRKEAILPIIEKEKVIKDIELSFEEVVTISPYISAEKDKNISKIETIDPHSSVVQERYSLAVQAYKSKDFENAFSIWKDLANKGHVEAMCRVAGLYGTGEGVEKDTIQSKSYFRKASISGHGEAQYAYATILNNNRNAYFWYNAVAQNKTATSDSRGISQLRVRTLEAVSDFSLTNNELELLRILERNTTAKDGEVDESLFVGY